MARGMRTDGQIFLLFQEMQILLAEGNDVNLLSRRFRWDYPVFSDEYEIEWREDSVGVMTSPQGQTADYFFGSPGTAILPIEDTEAFIRTALTTLTGALIRFRVRGKNSFGNGNWDWTYWTDP